MGIIPACAGSTVKSKTYRRQERDHPRMCGEHRRRAPRPHPQTGSSPHVRGAPFWQMSMHFATGIIPACAGSTPHQSSTAYAAWDHPRMCGEHFFLQVGDAAFQGSSPHVRGAQSNCDWGACNYGIIPACAGSTKALTNAPPHTRDHPRMCGEHLDAVRTTQTPMGSSPHVRGAQGRDAFGPPVRGIIPACAGSTRCGHMITSQNRDHPRMCGEHLSSFSFSYPASGSSPHVRGARSRPCRPTPASGIIPACAGSTDKALYVVGQKRDHPRMCGEH